MQEYIIYISVRLFGLVVRALPLNFALRLGDIFGLVYYYLDNKHRNIVYTNLKIAFDKKKSHCQIKKITKEVFKNLGKNIIEVLRLPKVDLAYINKYISIENRNYIDEALEKKKGLVLLATHLDSWELSNAACGLLYGQRGHSYKVVVREQKPLILNNLLNRYRQSKGCGVIPLGIATREVIKNIKNGQIVAIVMDQGVGDEVSLFKFMTRQMPLATGGMRIALKFDSEILLAFIVRVKGPYHKIYIEKIPDLAKTDNLEYDIKSNLEKAAAIFEKYLSRYPEQYLWFYKRWKYSKERSALILNDGKAGHLRQSEAVLKNLKDSLESNVVSRLSYSLVDIKFKNRFSKLAIIISSFFAHRRHCRGCLLCLKRFLHTDTYEQLSRAQADYVISCGSSLAPINSIISNENLGKSIVIMKPGPLSVKRFSLVIAPRHDNIPNFRNVFITEGAPNLMDGYYLKDNADKLSQAYGLKSGGNIGVLIGGDTKRYSLTSDCILSLCNAVKNLAREFGLEILVTTSRRTSRESENLVGDYLKDFPAVKLLVIANEKNIPEAVSGILGLSEIIVVSGESISMVSEAASSGKYTVVFNLKEKEPDLEGSRHRRFLENLQKRNYILLVEPQDLYSTMKNILTEKPEMEILRDSLVVRKAIRTIL